MIALVAVLAGCSAETSVAPPTSSSPGTPPDTGSPGPGAFSPLAAAAPAEVATGLDLPWDIAFTSAAAGSTALGSTALVSERDTGRILELDAAGASREIGTVGGIRHGGEGGLLGLAVDAENRLYAYSTGANGNRIERFALTGAAGSLGLGAPATIVDGLPAAGIHNGGRIAFGPDGMLYAGVGDAGMRPSAQDLGSLGGKILRMTPDGAVPADNPFASSLVYSYGHRNVQGLGWAADGTMFASEFGQNTWDELNIIEAGGNYGWPEVEGLAGAEGFIDPVQQWAPAEASPSGLAVIDDTVFIANLRGGVLRAVPVADPATSRDYFTGEFGRLRTVAAAPDGSVWFLTNNSGGQPAGDRIMSVRLAA